MPFPIALALAPFLAPLPALAQESDSGLWLSANGTVALRDDTAVTLSSEFRWSDSAGGHDETIVGIMATHRLASGIAFGAGYQHNRSVGEAPARREHRLRQQVTVPLGRLGPGAFAARVRFEQRTRNDGDDVHLRLRPRIAYGLPLGESGAGLELSHESFLGTRADWNDQSGLFRMRNAVAVAVPLKRRIEASIGYLNQYDFGRDGRRDAVAHVLTAGVALGF